jgi:CDP-diacylglycerol pyrophosphatase
MPPRFCNEAALPCEPEVRFVRAVFIVVGAAASICLAVALVRPPAWAGDRDALRRIVQEQCLPHWRSAHDPAPCVSLELAGTGTSGYAVLPDRKGGAHFLLIPTDTITGIESPALELPATPNFFLAAWQARDRLSGRVGRPVPRTAVGLAINPQRARSQDQLHIHIECLRPDVARALAQSAGEIGERWTAVHIDGALFEAQRLAGDDPADPTPFVRLATSPPEPSTSLGDFSLLLAGMQFTSGPGFVLLAGRERAAELLLDSSCALAAG